MQGNKSATLRCALFVFRFYNTIVRISLLIYVELAKYIVDALAALWAPIIKRKMILQQYFFKKK